MDIIFFICISTLILSFPFQDLIKYTPEDHQDFGTLNDSLHMIQTFLNDYNLEHRGELYPGGIQERNQRHLVKNSFTVELADGSRQVFFSKVQ